MRHGRKGCKNHTSAIHRIETRRIGGDAPSSPAALCKDCHGGYRDAAFIVVGATLSAPCGQAETEFEKMEIFRGTAFMGIMRWAFCNRLQEECADAGAACGYIAKNTRIRNGLDKDHAAGARCTGGNPLAAPLDAIYMRKAAGKRNRQLHKATITKGGKRTLNQSPKYVHGFQLFDRVQMPDRRKGFIFGRRSSVSFEVRALDGAKLSAGTGRKKLKPLEKRKAMLAERGVRLPPHA